MLLGLVGGALGGWLAGSLARRAGAPWRQEVSAAVLALLGALLAERWGPTLRLVPAVALVAGLWGIALVDLTSRRVPNTAVVGLVALGALARLGGLGMGPTGGAAVLALVVGLSLGALSLGSRGGLGMGDVKLAAALAWILGWPVTLWALGATFLAGGLAAAGILLLRRGGAGTALPYAPFLFIGGLTALLLAGRP